jgi:very-short-patch-repair endonuclease
MRRDPCDEAEVRSSPWPHSAIAGIAGKQRGLITVAQLKQLGVSKAGLSRAASRGVLVQIHRGVYALLPLRCLPPLAREHAALLHLGPGAVLSHGSAAQIWGLRPPPPDLHVTVIGRDLRSREGIRVHRAAAIDRADLRHHHGLALTAPARTLLDLEAGLSDEALEQVFAEAIKRHVMRRSEARSMVERHPGHPGIARLRELASETHDVARLRADTERRFLRLVRRAGLPQPETQAPWGPYELDFLWREERVVVETDGYLFHSLRSDLESDHRRDAKLQAAGFIVLRFSWRLIRYQPEVVLAEVAGVLAMRRAAA